MKIPAFLHKLVPRADRRSHARLIAGRVRLSTVGLVVAFIALFWVYETYDVPAQNQPAPANQVVPPGFVPDPEYTWVPRTNVAPRSTEPTTTTTTTPTTTTSTTSPALTTPPAPGEPGGTPSPTGPGAPSPAGPTTTVIDQDGPGPSDAQTFTQLPPETPAPGVTTPTTPPSP